MQNNQDAIREALRMAQSPAGQQLMRMLQQSGGENLENAMNRAAAGDYGDAKKVLNQLLADPQARKLLEQMGGNHGQHGR